MGNFSCRVVLTILPISLLASSASAQGLFSPCTRHIYNNSGYQATVVWRPAPNSSVIKLNAPGDAPANCRLYMRCTPEIDPGQAAGECVVPAGCTVEVNYMEYPFFPQGSISFQIGQGFHGPWNFVPVCGTIQGGDSCVSTRIGDATLTGSCRATRRTFSKPRHH
jgi:hypothetical protein